MIRSRVFVFFAIALFVAGCPCAGAVTAPENSKDKAEEKVTELQGLTAGVLGTAKKKFNDAESLKSTVESQKTKAVNAESAVRTAAAAITATERKTQADAVAVKATQELGNCVQLYDAAKEKAEEASKSFDGFVKSASDVDNKAKNELQAALSTPADYPKVIEDAETAKTQTTTLNQQMQKSTVLSTANAALWKLQAGAKKVQVFKYQAESLVVVSNIETKMSEAKTDIQSIQQIEKEIDTIVKEMTPKLQSAPDSLSSVLSSLCSTAEGQLRTATNKLKEANKCNTDMQGQKTQLDDDLRTLMATDDESMANTQATAVKWQEGHINSEIEKIKAALGEAETSLRSAKNVQQQMRETVSKHNSQSVSEISKEKAKESVPTTEVTTPIQSGGENNPTITATDKRIVIKTDDPAITETEKTALEKFKNTMDKTSGQPVDTHLDSAEENKSVQLTHKEKQNPKDDKSELLNKDQLRNITKDITNNPLIGGEVPTRSTENDSAVTVFIPLLMILVISAVLH